MSGLLTVNGGYNGTNGLLPVPTNFTAALGDSSIATALQTYLNGISTSLPAGGSSFLIGFENDDIATGAVYSVSGSGAGALVDITNTDTTGSSNNFVFNDAVTVPSITTDLVVQAPAQYVAITGSDSTSFALFGSNSSVHYSVTGGQGSIYAAGGKDVIGVYSAGTTSDIALYSAGSDSINVNGDGNDTITAVGNATTTVLVGDADATVSATGASSVNVTFSRNSGGDVDFINNSTNAGTVYTGSFGGANFAPNSITVFGGSGGGIYVGGRGGDNSLIGGTGLTTMIGGGNGDVISVTASVGGAYNELFTGDANETLLAGAGSGNNAFNVGLYDYGVGSVLAAGVASSDGSGTQVFDIGNTNGETVTGSSVAGASNIFDVIGSSTTGGGNFAINDFSSTGGTIYLVDSSTQAPSDAQVSLISGIGSNALITLTDGTTITLKGVSASAVTTSTGSFGETVIT